MRDARRGLHGWRTLLLAFASPLLLGNDGLEPETLLRDFEIIVFGAELGQQPDGRLHKWRKPIRVYLDIRAGEAELYRRLTADHLADLAELTGLQIGLVETAAEANVVMVFDRDAHLLSSVAEHVPDLPGKDVVRSQAFCFAYFWHSRNSGEIIQAVVGIPSDRAASEGLLPHCIVEETTQILGLPNDSDDVYPSIFNDRSVFDFLTPHDRALVRLLYDPRLPVGADQKEALKTVRQLLREQGF